MPLLHAHRLAYNARIQMPGSVMQNIPTGGNHKGRHDIKVSEDIAQNTLVHGKDAMEGTNSRMHHGMLRTMEECWASQVIQAMWDMAFTIWEHRNKPAFIPRTTTCFGVHCTCARGSFNFLGRIEWSGWNAYKWPGMAALRMKNRIMTWMMRRITRR
jgi:hypothetical protein